jgi:hypothetical protein
MVRHVTHTEKVRHRYKFLCGELHRTIPHKRLYLNGTIIINYMRSEVLLKQIIKKYHHAEFQVLMVTSMKMTTHV